MYTVPTFNLPVNIWRFGAGPPALPALVTIGNLAYGRRMARNVDFSDPGFHGRPDMYLLLPAGTDIRDNAHAGASDLVEVGAGSKRFYNVEFVEDSGGGFRNEHRVALLAFVAGWPVPIPRPALALPVTMPVLVASGVSADSGSFVSLSFTAPAGLMTAYFAMTNVVDTSFRVTSSTAGVLPFKFQRQVAGSTFVRFSITAVSWMHPGGIASIVAGTTNPSTVLGAVFAMPGLTFDQTGNTFGNATPTMAVASGLTVLTPETAVAAFAWDNGTLPAVWSAPFIAGLPAPLSQTFGSVGPLVMDCGIATGLAPGVQTATETLAVPSIGEWAGGIMTVGP